LFDLYIDTVLDDWKLINPKSLQQRNNKYMNKILFADTQILPVNTEDHLQENITK
jgi:hypothetical protein